MLDVQWNTHLRGGLAVDGEADFRGGVLLPQWTALDLESGVTPATLGTRPVPGYRKIGPHVFIEGGVSLEITSGGNDLIAVLPEGYRPAQNVYGWAQCASTRLARIVVNTAGNLVCEWVYNIGGSRYTGDLSWLQINISYFVD